METNLQIEENQFDSDNATSSDKISLLLEAICNADYDITESVLKQGTNPDEYSSEPINVKIPLIEAAKTGNAKLVELLLTYKADPNSRTFGANQTALQFAALEGHIEATQVLLQYNADVNIISFYDERTALHYAAIKNCEQIVTLLLKSKAHVDLYDVCGEKPIHAAARYGSINSILVLINHQPEDINVKTCNGKTSLHLAIEHEQVAAIKILLENGASIDIPDNDSITPLQLAAEKNNFKVSKLLNIQALKNYLKELSTHQDTDRLSLFGYKAVDKKKAAEALKSVVCDKQNPACLNIYKNFLNDGHLKEIYTSLLPVIKKVEAKYKSTSEYELNTVRFNNHN